MPDERDPFEALTLTLAFPVGGVDQAQPVWAQTDKTCPDARNVRAFPPSSRRLGGGRRGGYIKALRPMVGVGQRRINQLAVVQRFPDPPISTVGTLQPVVDDFTTYINNGMDAGHGMDLLGNYHVFRKNKSEAWVLGPEAPGGSPKTTFGDARAVLVSPTSGRAKTVLFIDTTGTDATGDTGVAIAYPTTNDVTADFFCDTNPTTPNAETDSPCYCGPFVRGTNTLTRKVVAYLEYTGTPRTVRLVIDRLTETTQTRLKTSSKTFTLKNTTTRIIGPTIQLRATATTLTATVTWDAGAAAGVSDTLTVEDQVDNTQTRAGVTMLRNEDGISATALGTRRALWRLSYTRRIPYDYPVLAELNGQTTTLQSSNYYLPTGFKSSGATLATVVPTVNSGPITVGATTAYPLIDTDNPQRYFDANAATNETLLTRTQILSWGTASQPGQVRAIDLLYRRGATSSNTDQINPCFQCDESGHAYMVRVELFRSYLGSATTDYGQTTYHTIRIVAIFVNGGTRTRKVIHEETINPASPSGSSFAFPTFCLAQGARWKHVAGANSGGTITCSVNGMDLWSKDYSADTDWTTGAPAPSGLLWTTLGLGVDCGSDATANNWPAGFRIVNIAAPSASVLTVPEGSDVLMFTTNRVDVGVLGANNSPAQLTAGLGGGFAGAGVEYGVLRGKVYAVDGTTSREIVPIGSANGVREWLNVSGTDIDRCQLACTWRGRLVIARQSNNADQWYMSAVNDPINFSFGIGPAATRAYTGTDSLVGKPGDAITALIPFSDDYLIMGADSSLWVMRGDPGAGGRCDLLSDETGILGARAWTFDELGNLYFFGSNGLFIMPRGAFEYQNVLGRRLAAYTETVDAATTLVQLAYDALKRSVHVFLTPRDGLTAGVHLVYDIGANAPWLDELPVKFGPWSVAQIAGGSGEDRRYLIGCNDGAVRRPDDAALSDDGAAIASWVRYPAMEAGQGDLELMIVSITPFGALSTGAVEWSWRTGRSPAEVNALAITPAPTAGARSGTWFASGGGYQPGAYLRLAGGAHQLVIYQSSKDETWAMEKVLVEARPGGRRR